MAYELQYGNYVKFIRGNQAAWNSLTEKSGDTLYFISDQGSTAGKLYLGSKLIADGSLTSATALQDLNDVIINEIGDQSLLVYNAASGKWENKSIIDVLAQSIEVFKGATADEAGIAGLVPAPTAGQQDMFLRADGSWASPNVDISSKIDTLESTISTLVPVADEGKSIREIAADEATKAVAAVVDGAPEAFDTLKEISDWIIANPDVADIPALQLKVDELDAAVNGVPADEETGAEAVPGLVENLVAVDGKVSALTDRVVALEAADEEMGNRVSAIEQNLKWQDLVETV